MAGRGWWPGPPFPCSWGEGLGWAGGPEPDHLDIVKHELRLRAEIVVYRRMNDNIPDAFARLRAFAQTLGQEPPTLAL
eukprot:2165385-Alexandrium_andersonii.AAC.1